LQLLATNCSMSLNCCSGPATVLCSDTHVVRGGSWRDPMPQVNCAVRGHSAADWKNGDQQLPRSLYWFRIVRPVALPGTEEMRQYWNSGVERE
jgi:hypothetical protein